MIVEMGDKKVDLAKAFPFDLGDLMALEEWGAIKGKGKGKVDFESPAFIGKLVHHFVNKVNPDITMDEIKRIDITKLEGISNFLYEKMNETETNRPT